MLFRSHIINPLLTKTTTLTATPPIINYAITSNHNQTKEDGGELANIEEVITPYSVVLLRFCNHVNLIAVSEHHHHHNSDSKMLQLSFIIIIPLRFLGHFPESIPELLRGHDYSEFVIITPSSLSYSEFITGISYVNGIR